MTISDLNTSLNGGRRSPEALAGKVDHISTDEHYKFLLYFLLSSALVGYFIELITRL